MTCHRFYFAFMLGLVLAGGTYLSKGEISDWRLELLAEEGLSTQTADLEKFLQSCQFTPEAFENAVLRLGDRNFATREQAQLELLRMGSSALPRLRAIHPHEQVEVRLRLREIRETLGSNSSWSRQDVLRDTVANLLSGQSHAKTHNQSGIFFAEFFKCDQNPLSRKYRQFQLQSEPGTKAMVSHGMLHLMGPQQAGEGDTCLLLNARHAGLDSSFPEKYRIEVQLGGTAGGEGVYHIGVAIGNAKALYHPGYDGGGFRFEKLLERTPLTSNTEMGFTPSPSELQVMSIDVARNPSGDVSLDVRISGQGVTFRKHGDFKKDVIGDLSAIALVRSGRAGGDAMFDNLVLGRRMP